MTKYHQIIKINIFFFFALTIILCKYVAVLALIGVWLTVFQSLEKQKQILKTNTFC